MKRPLGFAGTRSGGLARPNYAFCSTANLCACALFCVCTRARNNLDTCVHEFLSAKYAGQEDRVDHFQRFF